MLSKSARAVTFVGSRYSALNLNKHQFQSCCFVKYQPKLCMLAPQTKLMSSLAEDILKAKREQEKGGKEEKAEGDPKKGPQPLTKWQKRGYQFFGVFFTISSVAYAILFCK